MIPQEDTECSKLIYETVKHKFRKTGYGIEFLRCLPPLESGSDVDPVVYDKIQGWHSICEGYHFMTEFVLFCAYKKSFITQKTLKYMVVFLLDYGYRARKMIFLIP